MNLSRSDYIACVNSSPGLPNDCILWDEEGREWPEPEPLGGKLPPVEPLLPKMMPPVIWQRVTDIAERMQVPPDFPAVAVIAVLAALIGRRACIQPKERDPWTVVPNLWGGIVAEPGQLKSPILNSVLEPVKAIEREWQEEHKAALQIHQDAAEKAEIERANWKDAYKTCLKARKPTPEKPAGVPEAPLPRRLMTQDATLQSLHQLLATNQAGIFVFRDELTGWFAQLDKSGREQERGFYLEGWNGDSSYTIDTIARGTVHVPHVCLSVFGGIQPARLRFYLEDALRGGPTNDGLMQRFQLLVWPDPLPNLRVYVDKTADEFARAQMEALCRRLASMNAEEPAIFRFDQEAQALFRKWLPDLENRCQDLGENAAMRAHLSKYRSLMPSIALVFALADGAEGLCHLDHAVKAASYCKYLESHARRVYATQASPEHIAAYTLGQKLIAGELGTPGSTFNFRELHRKGWSGLGTPEEAQAALAVLEELGWIRKLPKPEGKVGRSGRNYVINPRLEPRHADA